MIKEILKESFKITLRHPSLWLWGFLSTFVFFSANDLSFIFIARPLFLNFIDSGNPPSPEKSPAVLYLIFVVFLAFLLLLLIAVLAEIKIILNIKKIKFDNWETKRRSGLIWLILFFRFLETLFFFIIWLPNLIFLNKINDSISFLLIFLSALLSLLIILIARYTIFYLLIKRSGFIQAITNSFLFLKTNWLPTIKISFLLIVIVFIYTALVLPLWEGGIFTYPLRLVNFLLTALLGHVGFWLSFIVTAALVSLFQIIVTGFIASYQITSWVLLFLTSSGYFVNKNEAEKSLRI